VPAAGCAALGCAARVTPQERNRDPSRLPPSCVPRTLFAAADSRECLQGTLNARGGSRAKIRRRHEPQRRKVLCCQQAAAKTTNVRWCRLRWFVSPNIRRLAAQRSFTQPIAAFTFQRRDAQRRAETRRGSAGPPNGRESAAVKS
jgi:hypothetical protein